MANPAAPSAAINDVVSIPNLDTAAIITNKYKINFNALVKNPAKVKSTFRFVKTF